MNARNTIIVVAVFVLLVGALVLSGEFNRGSPPEGTPTAAVPQVLNLQASNVKSVLLTDLRAGRQVQMTRTDNGWQIDKPVQKPGDSATIEDSVDQLATLQASRVLTDVSNFNQYFITPTLDARLTMTDTTSYGITVGTKTPDGSSYYAAYTGDKSKVFLISSTLVTTLMGWFDTPPYEPTAAPTATVTPPVTPTTATTPTIAPPVTGTATP